jgi:regulation of enolase protein 1 (concanavalin A-like superfamily)
MIQLGGVPDLDWVVNSGVADLLPGGRLEITAAPGTDWTNDATGGAQQHRAALLGFVAPEAFALSARVLVEEPRTTFDAGVLAIWGDADHWAKLCFERSPLGESMVVSVVTNTWSDDCNSTVVEDPAVHLRLSRLDRRTWAFHSSTDGNRWDFVRLFRLDWDGPVHVGFLAQAPTGERCRAVFDGIRFVPQSPSDLRDGF